MNFIILDLVFKSFNFLLKFFLSLYMFRKHLGEDTFKFGQIWLSLVAHVIFYDKILFNCFGSIRFQSCFRSSHTCSPHGYSCYVFLKLFLASFKYIFYEFSFLNTEWTFWIFWEYTLDSLALAIEEIDCKIINRIALRQVFAKSLMSNRFKATLAGVIQHSNSNY